MPFWKFSKHGFLVGFQFPLNKLLLSWFHWQHRGKEKNFSSIFALFFSENFMPTDKEKIWLTMMNKKQKCLATFQRILIKLKKYFFFDVVFAQLKIEIEFKFELLWAEKFSNYWGNKKLLIINVTGKMEMVLIFRKFFRIFDYHSRRFRILSSQMSGNL